MAGVNLDRVVDWDAVPVVDVPIERFVIPLHHTDPRVLFAEPDSGAPVRAYSRDPGLSDVHTIDGRHRVLRRLYRGETTVPTQLLLIP